MKICKLLLVIFLKLYKRSLKQDLSLAQWEYDIVCLDIIQKQIVLSIKNEYPDKITQIETLITEIKAYKKYE